MRSEVLTSLWLLALTSCLALGLGACVGPSRSEREERAILTRRLMEAEAVHLPPADRAPCVGVTARLSQGGAAAEAERRALAARLTDAEVERALDESGLARCTERFEAARTELGLGPEPVALELGYGVGPEGSVCAVVEQRRPELLDPAARPLLDAAARCAKDALFAARFPEGRVEEDERIVRRIRVPLSPVAAASEGESP